MGKQNKNANFTSNLMFFLCYFIVNYDSKSRVSFVFKLSMIVKKTGSVLILTGSGY